jgi:hypothetical protein
MTEPDDRAHGALPEGTPDDEALDDDAQPVDENDADSPLDDETAGEDAAFAEPEEVAGAAAVASTTPRAGRASAASRATGRGPRGLRGPATPARAQTASDIAVHVDDRASGIFVIGVIAIFVLIFLNAVVLGKGGFLTPIPTPRPVASAAPAASVAPIASASPAASPQASAAPSATAGPSAAASATPKPSASAKASASPKPSASPAPSPSK